MFCLTLRVFQKCLEFRQYFKIVKEKETTEDEMVGWHHQLNGHQFGQTPGDGEGQGSLVCCSLWGRRELDTTE